MNFKKQIKLGYGKSLRLVFIIIYCGLFNFVLCGESKQENTSIDNLMLEINKEIRNLLNKETTTPPIRQAKTLVSFPSSCFFNPMLELLPSNIRTTLNETLVGIPEKMSTKVNYCSKYGTEYESCCTRSTFTEVKKFLTNTFIPAKMQIFDKNLAIYKRIITEHRRNLIGYYKFNEEQHNMLFGKYKELYYKMAVNAENIVRNSVMFFWDSLCSFICSPKVEESCKIFNVTYSYNNTIYFDYEFECELEETSNAISNLVKSETEKFMNEMRNINSTLEEIYETIKNNSTNVIEMKTETSTFFKTGPNNTLDLYNNSINDGLYVSKKTGKEMICENHKAEIINPNIGNHKFSYEFTCEDLLNKICVPFTCLDNSFLQFYSDSYSNQTTLLDHSNFTKISIKDQQTSSNIALTDTEIEELIAENIVFSGSYFIQIFKRVLLIFLIYIIFEL